MRRAHPGTRHSGATGRRACANDSVVTACVTSSNQDDDGSHVRTQKKPVVSHGPFAIELERSVSAYAFERDPDRKSTRLNSSHVKISYAVFCLKKKKHKRRCGKSAGR